MKIKTLLITILALLFVHDIYGQAGFQAHKSEGFNVKCGCKLKVNSAIIQMSKRQGVNNILSAYICSENEGHPEVGTTNNITIYDEASGYNNILASNYSLFEKKYLEQYATNLKYAGISYFYTIYQGVSAIEYTFNQQGLPTKAIIFLKNKKTYLLQVGTKISLKPKFNSLKLNFVIL